jgi:hypothetical protein
MSSSAEPVRVFFDLESRYIPLTVGAMERSEGETHGFPGQGSGENSGLAPSRSLVLKSWPQVRMLIPPG